MRLVQSQSSTKSVRPAALLAAGAVVLTCLGLTAAKADETPIKIGVIGEESSVAGASITKAAQLAADEINAQGGIGGRKIELFTYDDHSSASDAVRAFQRAVTQDHVNAVIASYISEVALAIEPWAGRLHMPTITPGAAEHRDLQGRARRLRPLQIHVPWLDQFQGAGGYASAPASATLWSSPMT